MMYAFLLILVADVQAEAGETLHIDQTLAIGFLYDCLRIDEAYEDGMLEGVCYLIE